MIKKSDYIIIIPARKGSKRLKNKNLKILGGKPLIEHTIEYALKNFNKEQIWVNSDSNKILEISKKFKINTYKRNKELATDKSLTSEVIFDQVYNIYKKVNFEYVIILQPTSPFRPVNLISNAMEKINSQKLTSLFSVSTLHKKFGKIIGSKFFPRNYELGQRSQELKELYFENGLLYIVSINLVLNKTLINQDSFPLIDDSLESTIDIDSETDFRKAELYLKLWK